MKKKVLIPLITAACLMYGCSSTPTASADSTTSAETTETASETSVTTSETTTPETKADNSASDPAENTDSADKSAETDTAKSDDKSDDTDNTNSADKSDKEAADKKEENKENADEESLGEIEEKHIETVKNACPENFPTCSYGKAFAEFFTSPEWKYFESTDGRDVVEFTGECLYAGTRTKTRLQLIVDMNTSTVTPGALYYNNTPQSTTVISSSLESIFKQYADKHDISYLTTQPLTPEETNSVNLAANSPSTASADSPENTTSAPSSAANPSDSLSVNQGGSQAALSFAAWSNPNTASWYSPSTEYYLIPYIDSAGNPSMAFTTALTGNTPGSAYTAAYYTDAVSAVRNEAGGLIYQAYLYRAEETPVMIGLIEASWSSEAAISGMSVKMINGSQAMDTSVAANDYTYSGTIK